MSTAPTNAPPAVAPVTTPGLDPGPDIDYDALVTEDHQPVDRIFVEKLYRLLTRPLYASWPGPADGRPFCFGPGGRPSSRARGVGLWTGHSSPSGS